MDSYILCGMQFGDEGKGTFVDYLAHTLNANSIVKYNGGSQASHTVITPDGICHKFSQLGSGMFLESCHTYLTENMVINLDNIMVELEVFSQKTNLSIPCLLKRIHINENCFVVTPYHKLINKLREFSKGNNRRGTVGTGVSEVRFLLSESQNSPYETILGLQVKDIFCPNNDPTIDILQAIQKYVDNFYSEHMDIIWQNVPKSMIHSLEQDICFFLDPKISLGFAMNYIIDFKNAPKNINLSQCIYSTYETSFKPNCSKVIFEGSQGLLIDGTYGIKPNTTFLDTTNTFALNISKYGDNIHKIGIAKAFTSRHGFGIFPTESCEVSSKISDENQDSSFWNGSIRFGWFDAVLLRYAQKINQVDELYLSSLDKLDIFETIKICNEYIYTGIIDKTFEKIFDFYVSSNGETVITNIKVNDEALTKYLEKCIPKYICVDGWKTDISNVCDKKNLPEKCLNYISILEKLTNIPITIISVGPTRNNKIYLTSP